MAKRAGSQLSPSPADCCSLEGVRRSWYDEFTCDSVTASEHVETAWERSVLDVTSDSVHFRGSENGVLADHSTIQADGTPFAEMFKEFNLSDYKAFHTIECLASFAWGQMLNPTASGEQVAEYLKSSCSCLSEQSPHTTYEEQAAEALQALRAGNPAKARLLFSTTVGSKYREGKAALQQAAAATRNEAALVRLHDPVAAVALYRKATELDPENVCCWRPCCSRPVILPKPQKHGGSSTKPAKKIIEDWAWLQIRRKRA